MKTINQIVSQNLNVPSQDLFSRSRKHDIVTARALVWYFQEKQGMKHGAIADLCGWDRSTVCHGINRIKTDMKNYSLFKGLVFSIEQQINKYLYTEGLSLE